MIDAAMKYRIVSLKDDVYEKLEKIRRKEGLRSIAATVSFLTHRYLEACRLER